MSWFKKTITSVSVSTSRVIPDNMLIDSVKTGVIKGIFSENQLVENILEDVIGSVGTRAEALYRYGRDHYSYGLPSSTLISSHTGETTVKAVLEQLEGTSVTIDYYQYGALNTLHYGWLTLVNSYGYDQASNELTGLSTTHGTPVYLVDLQVVITNASMTELANGALAQWGSPAAGGEIPGRFTLGSYTAATSFAVDATAPNDYIRVTYTYGGFIRGGINEFFDIPMSTLDPDLGYFQVKYHYYNGTKNVYKYWTYDDGAGTYPILDAIFTTAQSNSGSYFPYAYFRRNKQSVAVDNNDATYLSTKKLLKYINMDFQQVTEGINSNPDIVDVETALMMFGVPANSTNQMELRYLFDYFKNLHSSVGTTGGIQSVITDKVNKLLNQKDAPIIGIVIQDAVDKQMLGLSGIYMSTVAGTVGSIGTVTSSIWTDDITEAVPLLNLVGETEYVYTQPTVVHAYRKQVSDNVYEEILVYDLSMSHYLNSDYDVMIIDEATERHLLIPLDHSITVNYSIPEREELYSRSLHYVFESKQEQKLKWYQTGLFQMILIVVAVVITVLDWGSDGGSVMAAALAAGTVTLTMIMVEAIVFIFQFLIVRRVMKYFVKEFGLKGAAIFAIIMAIYSYNSTASNLAPGQSIPWSDVLLQAVNGLSSAVQLSYQESLIGLQKEAEEFNIFAQEKYKLLGDANKLLESNSILTPEILLGVTPTEFYDLKLAGNVGIASVDVIGSYVDISLTLPKLRETIDGRYGYAT